MIATAEFEAWFMSLRDDEAESVAWYVDLLEAKGAALKFPYCSGVHGSRYSQMRELRIQHAGKPYRVFYCFAPDRRAVVLIGGRKTGNNRFYEEMIPWADRIYDDYLRDIDEGRES